MMSGFGGLRGSDWIGVSGCGFGGVWAIGFLE